MSENKDTKISVIIPTYNRKKSLIKAINSVVNQTYPNIETIVIDDHSETPVDDWIGDVDLDLNDLTLCRHSENKGAPAARKTGVKKADGDFLAFLDSDDKWKPRKLEYQYEAFDENPDVGLVYVGREYISNGEIEAVKKPSKSGDLHKELLCKNFIGSYSCIMVRTDVVKTAGMPDNRFPAEQDWEWYIRIARDWKIKGIEKVLVSRFGSGISSKYAEKRGISYPLLLEKYESDATEYGYFFVQYWQSRVLFKVGWEALIRTNEPRVARRYFIKSILHNPFNYPSWAFFALSIINPLSKYVPQSVKQRIGKIIRP